MIVSYGESEHLSGREYEDIAVWALECPTADIVTGGVEATQLEGMMGIESLGGKSAGWRCSSA